MSVFDTVATSGALEPLDLHFAGLIRRRAAEDSERSDAEQADIVALSAALLSRERSRGHSCIDPRDWAGRPFPSSAAAPEARNLLLPPLPDPLTWRRALADSDLVGDGSTPAPMVVDDAGRLYLARYWHAEQRLAANLRRRLEIEPPSIDAAALSPLFQDLFSERPPGGEVDDQAVAAATALASRVTLISGGPGTGKTTTVGRVMALLLATEPEMRIALAAPTGKAAARLGEAVVEQGARLPVDEGLRVRLPASASTLHRLLGYQPRRDRFRHHGERPLALDALVIDEVSMVDLLLMDAALDALPPTPRIILLGDRDQLTSVETGSVFGDLCDAAHLGGDVSPRIAELYRALSGRQLENDAAPAQEPDDGRPSTTLLEGTAVELRVSYRFRDQPGISCLAARLRQGDAGGALATLDDSQHPEARRLEPAEDAEEALEPILEPLAAYLAAASPAEALERLGALRVLCARRGGAWGVERLNVAVERHLVAGGHPIASRSGAGAWYKARPILITANDYQIELFNGDLGVCWPEAGRMWAFFPGSGDQPRRLPLARLPPHETAWAMTVHKAQGSEFDHVLLVLGDADSRVMTRELLYTGATRARRSVVVVASTDVFRAAVARRGRRVSGLADALSGPPLWQSGISGDSSAPSDEPPAPKKPESPTEPETPDDDGAGQMSLFG